MKRGRTVETVFNKRQRWVTALRRHTVFIPTSSSRGSTRGISKRNLFIRNLFRRCSKTPRGTLSAAAMKRPKHGKSTEQTRQKNNLLNYVTWRGAQGESGHATRRRCGRKKKQDKTTERRRGGVKYWKRLLKLNTSNSDTVEWRLKNTATLRRECVQMGRALSHGLLESRGKNADPAICQKLV